jgi:hypothetical protein
MSESIMVRIEGKEVSLEDREYSGAELKMLGSIPPTANLVQEESDGCERGIRDEEKVRPKPGQNFYHSPKHRRG